MGSVVVAQGLSCSMAHGIFLDQGSKLCPLHWQADSQALRHQGSPPLFFRFFSHIGNYRVFLFSPLNQQLFKKIINSYLDKNFLGGDYLVLVLLFYD